MKKEKAVFLASGVWCVILTLVHFDAYWVYQLSRWGGCAAAVFCALNVDKGWQWPLWVLALLFNPIAPIHFKRDAWQVIDGVAACVFFVSGFFKK